MFTALTARRSSLRRVIRVRGQVSLKRVVAQHLEPYRACRDARAARTVVGALISNAAVRYVTDQPWTRTVGIGLFEILRVLAVGVGLL